MKKFIFVFILMFLTCINYSSSAAQTGSQKSTRPDKFATGAIAIDSRHLITDRFKIELWGIKDQAETENYFSLKGRSLLDRLLQDSTVYCSVFSWKGNQALARCLNNNDTDLAITLLEEGLVVVDRETVHGSAFADPYFEAEKKAEKEGSGLWRDTGKNLNIPGTLGAGRLLPLISALIVSILIGFAIVAYICARGFKHLASQNKNQVKMLLEREGDLKEREKFVVASMLESEINANKVKVEAFLVIYEEMLRNLKDPNKQNKYKHTGEIIQEQPRLARTIFDSNVEKMDLLGHELASEIAKFYSKIDPNPDYVTLDPDYPVEDAVHRVEKVIEEGQALIPPADRLLASLQIILRDKKSRKRASRRFNEKDV